MFRIILKNQWVKVILCFLGLAFSTAQVNALPLPYSLTSINSPEGRQYLHESIYKSPYNTLKKYYITQHSNYCGIASATMVLNASRGDDGAARFTQNNLFTPWVRRIVTPSAVARRGMSLDEVRRILTGYSLKAQQFYGNNLSLSHFKSLLKSNLSRENRYVITLFRRHGLHQAGGGHFSPIAAYDQVSDRVLVYDVASFHYPPTWVKTAELWRAMRGTGSWRGILTVDTE